MLTAQQSAELNAWLNQYTATAGRADANTAAAVWAAYSVVEDWFDPAETVEAAKNAADVIMAATRTHAGLMAEFLELSTHLMTGQRPAAPSGLGATYARDADPFDVYSRPVYDFRREIEHGFARELALQTAKFRAEELVGTDVALARRQASRTVFEAAQITEYRRVIRPELSKTGTCGLCIAAATQVYSVSDLLPIHTLCKCTEMPIDGNSDPANTFNKADLEKVYAGIPATLRRDLSKYRFAVQDHGELGPTLVPAAKQAAVPRANPGGVKVKTKPGSAAGRADALRSMSDDRLNHLVAVTEALKDSDYRTSYLAKLRAELARRNK